MEFETLTSEACTAKLDTVIAFIEDHADRIGLENKKTSCSSKNRSILSWFFLDG